MTKLHSISLEFTLIMSQLLTITIIVKDTLRW